MNELPMIGRAAEQSAAVQAFSFGDPEPVLDRRTILDMVECYHNGRWYEPPIPLDGLSRAFRASPHHASAIMLKRNLLVSSFQATPLLSRSDFAKAVQDFLVFGDCYFEEVLNRLGGVMRLEHSLAKYTRRGVKDGQYWYVPGFHNEHEFAAGRVVQVSQPDINQELYGLPEYLGALQSALLNENATLFRRRYYLNGSHAGYILYATGEIDEGDVDGMKEALKNSKGPGNFRNLFVHAPAGKEGSLKLLPISEHAAKDEFLGIKNTTRDDVLAAHRVPPQLLGIVPANAGGFGNIMDATDAFFELEIEPLQGWFLEVNERIGREAIAFKVREKREARPAPARSAA